jgi:hypothetical protein
VRTHDDEYVTSCSNSYGELQENDKGYKWIACGYQVNLHDQITSALCFSARLNNSSLEVVIIPTLITTYQTVPDNRATQHMALRWEDLYNALEGQKSGVEVADGHMIHCSTTVIKVKI